MAQLILDVSDDIYKMVRKHDQDKLSVSVISNYFVIEQIKEQLRLLEISMLSGEEKQFRESRIARLNHELARAKISFVQGILEDIRKISKLARIKDKETKKNIKFLLKMCRAVKKNGMSKKYGLRESNNVQTFKAKNQQVG